ncbi:MAG: PhzF family phenazine biosynthesis protein [Desulfobacterales bacterium]|jgi:PhzF family phenazine biosynthesis protein
MEVLKIAAFSHNDKGGNPAGVVICSEMPTETKMLQTAKHVGYSETAFLKQMDDGWKIRYFAPETEVSFCGHATIASGAVLGELHGEDTYKLYLNQGEISVTASRSESGVFSAALQSPNTWSKSAPQEYVEKLLDNFNFSISDLDPKYPVSFAFAGAKHLIIVLSEHEKLKEMSYEFEPVKSLMQKEGLTTINLIWIESTQTIYSRNPFPPGGVYEDPATGAAAAALGGYLRDINWQGQKSIEILQGQDMGIPSRLFVQYTDSKGESIKVSGETREIIET